MVSPADGNRTSTKARAGGPQPGGRPKRRRDTWTIVVGVVGAVVAAVLIIAVVQAGDDEETSSAPPVTVAAGSATETGAAETGAETPSSVTFAPDDAHANLPAEPGCDQLFVHSAMAMWTPILADELLDYDCPFPFEPDQVSMDGGAEDASIAAPFEPHRYQEIFDIIATEKFGMCAVTRLGEPSIRGFVYGFSTKLRADSCVNNDPNVEVIAREYASRPHRDEAANTSAGTVDRTLALGRWTITVDGDDPAAVERLAAQLEAIGASAVDP